MVPTLYDIVGITPPHMVDGIPQDPFDGVSFKSMLNDAKAKEVKHTQYFEIMGSRAIYHDGWMASAFGPREPWTPGTPPGIHEWTPDKDKWELYNVAEDWSQANDLTEKMPQKLADMKDLFLIEFTKNKGLPIGGGLYTVALHPELRITPPYTEWTFFGNITRMPEGTTPSLGSKNNRVTIDADIPASANGVLYALGAFSGSPEASRSMSRTTRSATSITCSRSCGPGSVRRTSSLPARRRSRSGPPMSYTSRAGRSRSSCR